MNRNFVLTAFLSLALLSNPATDSALADDPAPLSTGQTFVERELADQHGNAVTLGANADLLLLSFNMSLSKSIHKFLEEKDPAYLAEHRTQYVTDIAKMPGIITFMFAGPKMRRYPFPIILNKDEDFGPQFPQQDKKITAIKLGEDHKVETIRYFATMEEVAKAYYEN